MMLYLLVFLVAFIGIFVQQNPLLFGRKLQGTDFSIETRHDALDEHLGHFTEELGDDYDKYRNHCLRVLNFAKYHLGDAATTHQVELMSIALAYHDIALWSDGKLNYLDPSAKQLLDHLGDELSPEDLETTIQIILQHHKLTDWKGPNADLVNAVRKADWADATMGLVRFGLPNELLVQAYESIPEAGFHMMLAKFGKRLSPDSLLGQLDVLKILKL